MAGTSPRFTLACKHAFRDASDGDIVAGALKLLSASSSRLVVDSGLTITADGLTVTAGGVTVTAGGVTITAGGLTVTAGNSVITTADSLTVGGTIVPQEMVICLDLWSHASLKTRNLFYASAVGWTVQAIVYEPEIAEGTASVVCTVCKVTGNNVAVAATTPMCTAFAVTGTAGTPVVATLTSTAADLALSATNKIGCIFTGGDEFLDSGRGRLYIKLKRS